MKEKSKQAVKQVKHSYKNYKKYKPRHRSYWTFFLIVNNKKEGIALNIRRNLIFVFWRYLTYQNVCWTREKSEDDEHGKNQAIFISWLNDRYLWIFRYELI